MRILAVLQGKYGQRIADNLRRHMPDSWSMSVWVAPRGLPDIIDNPRNHVPQSLPEADLLLLIPEDNRLAELSSACARACGARAALIPRRDPTYVPPGLVKQLQAELQADGTIASFPMPFCALTRSFSTSDIVRQFAQLFGQPRLALEVHQDKISKAAVQCGAPCGCTRFVARRLVGVFPEEAETQAARLHQYYPCWASSRPVPSIGDSLIHVAAKITRRAVEKALQRRQDYSEG